MSPEKEIAKAAFAEAEKEAREKQVSEVKRIVTKTLEKLDTVRKEIKEKQEEERILKMDIDDLKEGRLDLIAERQEKDPEAKKVSVVIIIKEKEIIREKEYYPSPWYWPYTVTWQYYNPSFPTGVVLCSSGGNAIQNNSLNYTTTTNCTLSDSSIFEATATPTCITGSIAKFATVGSYQVGDHVVNLR
jgi:regulator of replication initiation timing